jgi:hypothetical protein
MPGTGLQRLRERLALEYGPGRATVVVGEGTKFLVIVTLPWKSMDSRE